MDKVAQLRAWFARSPALSGLEKAECQCSEEQLLAFATSSVSSLLLPPLFSHTRQWVQARCALLRLRCAAAGDKTVGAKQSLAVSKPAEWTLEDVAVPKAAPVRSVLLVSLILDSPYCEAARTARRVSAQTRSWKA
jgi:hypothetical protein